VALTSLDTNILVYAFQADEKREAALAVLDRQPIASVQILNEYAHVSRRKFGRPWQEIMDDLELVRTMVAGIEPVTDHANREALRIADRYRLSFFDALLLAVALASGVRTFHSEDMQHELVIDGTLRIVDPFR
jgi:predicted nucleic acid-binding protein